MAQFAAPSGSAWLALWKRTRNPQALTPPPAELLCSPPPNAPQPSARASLVVTLRRHRWGAKVALAAGLGTPSDQARRIRAEPAISTRHRR